jgi:serine phosphatase RsbU (regulator of sigma subunit)
VGGDFYQVFGQSDGAKLVVLGDVSGKGLKAAMTGTLALGALRALAAEISSPASVLTRLNRQMAESSEGCFITCVCLRLELDGVLTIANAGHLPPYRNGEELTVDADLPLGIVANCAYMERSFQLSKGDRLMILSDGVVEARQPGGELFGFDRTRAISEESAEAIAAAALGFGQEDDITVLTVVRKAGNGD